MKQELCCTCVTLSANAECLRISSPFTTYKVNCRPLYLASEDYTADEWDADGDHRPLVAPNTKPIEQPSSACARTSLKRSRHRKTSFIYSLHVECWRLLIATGRRRQLRVPNNRMLSESCTTGSCEVPLDPQHIRSLTDLFIQTSKSGF